MATETEHYKLKKPAEDDFYSVKDANGNMDIVDAALSGLEGGKAALGHTHTPQEIGARPNTWVPSAQEVGAISTSQKGAAGGVAELDAAGRVPASQLPSYVDDVLEFSSRSAFPAVGEGGKIYVAIDTNKTHRWSGSGYTEISPSIALGETEQTAYRGDRGKIAYEHTLDTTKHITAAERTKWNGKAGIFGPVTVSVPVGSWAGAGPWTQTVAVAGVTAADNGLTVCPVDIADNTARKAYKKAYACLAVEAETVAGGIKLTCRDGKPEITFQIVVKGVR